LEKKDKCSKCGLLRNQYCCKYCKYISDNMFNKCPKCDEFYSKDGEYYWRKENGGLDEFIGKNPEYRECCCRICEGNDLLRFCWNH